MPIVIGESTVQEGLDLVLTEKILPGQLEVRVHNAGVAGETTVCFGPISGGFPEYGIYPVVPGKPLVIDVLDGIRYRLSAHVGGSVGHSYSEVIETVGTAARTAVTLTPAPSSKAHFHGDTCP
jgi:hypothetical protein